MRRIKKRMCLLLFLVLVMLTAGCGSSEKNMQEETTKSENTHVIVDHLGYEVEIPYEINRIAVGNILPLPSVLTIFFDSAEKIVGMSPNSRI